MVNDPKVRRELIKHENELINARMGWFLTIHGFLFAGLAFAWEKGSALSVVFCFVGLCSSLSLGILLRYGIITIKRIEEAKSSEDEEHVIGRGYRETPVLIHLLLPWHLLPVVFFAAWVALIYTKLKGIG